MESGWCAPYWSEIDKRTNTYLHALCTGEARAWHYPPEVKFGDEDFDEEDLRVGLIITHMLMYLKLNFG